MTGRITLISSISQSSDQVHITVLRSMQKLVRYPFIGVLIKFISQFTYQCLINKMFAHYLGKSMEVYIDDILVNSEKSNQHLQHLDKIFFGKFLEYLVSINEKEANPNSVKEILTCLLQETKKMYRSWLIGALHSAYSYHNPQIEAKASLISLKVIKTLSGQKNVIRLFNAWKNIWCPLFYSKVCQWEDLYLYLDVSRVAVAGSYFRVIPKTLPNLLC